ncbi:MAG: rod shape-determining protein [Candidatus Paceibacterota bacterium]
MLEKILDTFYRTFSSDIGIDLGTANTLVYVRGKGIVINEPSIVALNRKTDTVVAVGAQAKAMIGRTPPHVEVIQPLVDGVISDFEVTEEMLAYLLNKAQMHSRSFIGPRVVIGVPSGITNVETRAVRDAARNAGAREVHIVEEPMAAAIGIKLPVLEPVATMILDIGGGTSDVAVISLGGVVCSKNLKIAGDRLNSDIISYIRNEFKILVGERTAEDVKIAIGSVLADPEGPIESSIRGRDLISGLPREVTITDADIREAIAPSIENLVDAVKEVLERTPPEMLADVMHRGLYISGGGALIRGLDQILEHALAIPVHMAEDPLTAVARGTGIILEKIEMYEQVLLENEDELPQTK